MQDYILKQFVVDGEYSNPNHDAYVWDDKQHDVIDGTTILCGPIIPLLHQHSPCAKGTNLFLFDHVYYYHHLRFYIQILTIYLFSN